MILLLHIAIALTSLAYTAYVFFNPSAARLKVSYGLIGGTIASGTALTLSMPGHLVQACVMGLLFTGASLYGSASARTKLQPAKSRLSKHL